MEKRQNQNRDLLSCSKELCVLDRESLECWKRFWKTPLNEQRSAILDPGYDARTPYGGRKQHDEVVNGYWWFPLSVKSTRIRSRRTRVLDDNLSRLLDVSLLDYSVGWQWRGKLFLRVRNCQNQEDIRLLSTFFCFFYPLFPIIWSGCCNAWWVLPRNGKLFGVLQGLLIVADVIQFARTWLPEIKSCPKVWFQVKWWINPRHSPYNGILNNFTLVSLE